ncbi:MAG: tautomerase family protein [Chthoniobacterales bacterium]
MPTYTVTVANLSLTTEQENSIAEAITESHHVNTGAPAFFAQVLFNAVAVEFGRVLPAPGAEQAGPQGLSPEKIRELTDAGALD